MFIYTCDCIYVSKRRSNVSSALHVCDTAVSDWLLTSTFNVCDFSTGSTNLEGNSGISLELKELEELVPVGAG